jgi:hypothetical protein
MFHMSADSGLFLDQPDGEASPADGPRCLPLYEAKMLHQFDHRWATYVDAPGKPSGLETADVDSMQKTEPTYAVRPRYWLPEREVLARIACVPARVAKAWLLTHNAGTYAEIDDDKSLEFAVASWLAGEWMRRLCTDELLGTNVKRQAQAQWRAMAEIESAAPPLLSALRRTRGGETLPNWLKWARQDADTPLGAAEERALREWQQTFHGASNDGTRIGPLLRFVDEWMDRRSPKWLMGWRDICRSTDVRTLIASVTPRMAIVGDFPCIFVSPQVEAESAAILLANLNALPLDYVARQKVSGAHLKLFHMRQLPLFGPESYKPTDARFVVSRVLELTYTGHDLKPWADDLVGFDLRLDAERGQPFAWNPERRALLRAELDAFYARLYGLTRDELRYILDPADVMGADYPSETFRVLKNNEMREFGEYRTQRLVLDAWDRLAAASPEQGMAAAAPVHYSPRAMIRNADESWLAGLVASILESREDGFTVGDLRDLLVRSAIAGHHLDAGDAESLVNSADSSRLSTARGMLDRVRPIVQRLEGVGAVSRQAVGLESRFRRTTQQLPGDVTQTSAQVQIARLLVLAEARRLEAVKQEPAAEPLAPKAHGVG